MSWTARSCVLPLLMLCMWRLQDGVQACSCYFTHPQEEFCQADVVMKAKVLAGEGQVDAGFYGVYNNVKYDIKQIKMLKGPDVEFDAIYTPYSSAACGVALTNGVEYLITGRLASGGLLHVSVCNLIRPWFKVSAAMKMNVAQLYQKGCKCQITRCYSFPCGGSNPAECLWTNFIISVDGLACIQRNDGSCAWYKRANSAIKGLMDKKY
uniref:metalloproteinase inhibitor 2-like n=1 Tax=Doryrhamphus excisus TaxID=161450 RepID=UPI0025AE3F36|nr:metalloproteinase inhibitor 2-like [Doryrhamphus excisus]